MHCIEVCRHEGDLGSINYVKRHDISQHNAILRQECALKERVARHSCFLVSFCVAVMKCQCIATFNCLPEAIQSLLEYL